MHEFGLPEMLESDRIHVSGLVVGEYCESWSHWEGSRSLGQWMLQQGITGICGKPAGCQNSFAGLSINIFCVVCGGAGTISCHM